LMRNGGGTGPLGEETDTLVTLVNPSILHTTRPYERNRF
jgi:hypothetical protein